MLAKGVVGSHWLLLFLLWECSFNLTYLSFQIVSAEPPWEFPRWFEVCWCWVVGQLASYEQIMSGCHIIQWQLYPLPVPSSRMMRISLELSENDVHHENENLNRKLHKGSFKYLPQIQVSWTMVISKHGPGWLLKLRILRQTHLEPWILSLHSSWLLALGRYNQGWGQLRSWSWVQLQLRSWSWNWSWNLRSWSWSWYSRDLPELGVGVETHGVGFGVGVDIQETCRSWSWNSRSWSWNWSRNSRELELGNWSWNFVKFFYIYIYSSIIWNI